MTRRNWLPGGVLLCGVLGGVALVVWDVDPAPWAWFLAIAFQSGMFQRRQPLASDGRAFSAPVPIADAVAVAIFLGGCLAGAAAARNHPTDTSAIKVPVLLVLAAMWLAAGLSLWLRPPLFVITPAGLTFRTVFRTHRFGWDDMTAPIMQAGKVLTFGHRRRITTGFFSIDPSTAATAVEYYRTHPDDRAAIGTPEEHQRWR